MKSWPAMVGAFGVVATSVVFGAAAGAQSEPGSADPPVCEPGETLKLVGDLVATQAKTYLLVPFEVPDGVTRVEVGYTWDPLEDTTLDLGLWDADGTEGPDGFRGWGGSRQGRLDKGMDPIWVQADSADRAFTPGAVEPGIWNVELGLAEIAEGGASYRVEVRCDDGPVGTEMAPDPVDADHVANPAAGWYRGDFHMHSWNSHPEAPDYDGFVEYARAAELDILPMTEYVVTRHHNELGAVQRENDDLLIWPGREVITYFGHSIVLGETPSTVEYREGLNGISLGDIVADSVADGALVGIAHPTVFPEEQFGSFCRGCEFQLESEIDWDSITMMELVTNQPVVAGTENPFIQTAIEYWQQQLDAGHRITAVSGSDDKLGPALGSTATMVYAEELSRAAVADGLRGGHAYIQVRGAKDSPTVEFAAVAGDATAMIGDSLGADLAAFSVTVAGGAGQTLTVFQNGVAVETVPVVGDSFTHEWTGGRGTTEGALGTHWRIEVTDAVSRTIITNPIFLTDVVDEPEETPDSVESTTTTVAVVDADSNADADESSTNVGAMIGLVALGLAIVAVPLIINRRS